MQKFFRLLPYILVLGMAIPGCVSYEHMVIVRDEAVTADTTVNYGTFLTENYRIRPYDLLAIQLNAYEEGGSTAAYINAGSATGNAMRVDAASLYVTSYTVNDSGDISLPLIGKFHVVGQTARQIQDSIDLKLKPYLNYVSTSVKLASFRVTVLGEVKTPGTQFVYNLKTNLLQVLGAAGDMTDFADRARIKVIRERGQETVSTYLDLTKPDFFNSEYYYLAPDDIIYVEPVKAKAVSLNTRTASVGLSAVSVAVVVVNLIISIQNNRNTR